MFLRNSIFATAARKAAENAQQNPMEGKKEILIKNSSQ